MVKTIYSLVHNECVFSSKLIMVPSRKMSTESAGTKQWQNYPAQVSAEENKMTGSDTVLRFPIAEVKKKISAS